MRTKGKKITSPSAAGNAGVHYEARIQAMFIIFMLIGKYAPILQFYSIKRIKVQTRAEGYQTDDILIVAKNPKGNTKRLIGQIKLTVAVTKGNTSFKEALQGAWIDFKNDQLFDPDKDILVLITKNMSRVDHKAVKYILEHIKSKSKKDFFSEINLQRYSPHKARDKLEAFRYHLTKANDGKDVSDSDLYHFLRSFEILEVNIDDDKGLDSSIIYSLFPQNGQDPQTMWGRLVDFALTKNRTAATITISDIPDDIADAFQKDQLQVTIPKELNYQKSDLNWGSHPNASKLALIAIIGGWNERNKEDIEVLEALLDLKYEKEWLPIAQKLINSPDSPLKFSDGIWRVTDKERLLKETGSQILDQHLERFKDLAVYALSEIDPALELPKEKRFFASHYGKEHPLSHNIIAGIVDGLALLGCRGEFFTNTSQNKAEYTALIVVKTVLESASWQHWATLNHFLPVLAEAAPEQFMAQVERELNSRPETYKEIHAQEYNDFGIMGANYLTGLLWALEGLAWKEEYLVRVANILLELAKLDPGGQWANRPDNSLVTIFLSWAPQTLASIEKRKVAIKMMLQSNSDITWSILLKLLPGSHQSTMGGHKPRWLLSTPSNIEVVTNQEHREMADFYGDLVVKQSSNNVAKLLELIEIFDHLTQPAFDSLVKMLQAFDIAILSNDDRRKLWEAISNFVRKHKRHSEAKWALPDELLKPLDSVVELFAPNDAFDRHQYLFSRNGLSLHEGKGGWDEQESILAEKRKKAIQEILNANNLSGVLDFANVVNRTDMVGCVLASIGDSSMDKDLLPQKLNKSANLPSSFIAFYISKRRHDEGWSWLNELDVSSWSNHEKAQLLCYLPFKEIVWKKAQAWSYDVENEYWKRVWVRVYDCDYDLNIPVAKLLEHNRFKEAIDVLASMIDMKFDIQIDLAIDALLGGLSDSSNLNYYHTVNLIKMLQDANDVADDDLFRIEWNYLRWLDKGSGSGIGPRFLERKIATDPKFFCDLIELIYRSKNKQSESNGPLSKVEEAKVKHASKLLDNYSIIPGVTKIGEFDSDAFSFWLEYVKNSTKVSGHYDIAMLKVGEVLVNSPEDRSGLWIDESIAAALNHKDAQPMREGFDIGVINSRGVHYVDPEGKPEKDLAEKYRQKADDVENAGFHRFAITLREISDNYKKEAERNIRRAKNISEDVD